MAELTHERLLQVLHYEPATGVFTWLARRGGSAVTGSKAGSKNKKGYVTIDCDGVTYYAHRLACFYMTKQWPPDDVDHRDRRKERNSWENLRAATDSQNRMNSVLYRNNSSGHAGVYYNQQTGNWYARISLAVGKIRQKTFGSHDEAVAARQRWEQEIYGEFARSAKVHTLDVRDGSQE